MEKINKGCCHHSGDSSSHTNPFEKIPEGEYSEENLRPLKIDPTEYSQWKNGLK